MCAIVSAGTPGASTAQKKAALNAWPLGSARSWLRRSFLSGWDARAKQSAQSRRTRSRLDRRRLVATAAG